MLTREQVQHFEKNGFVVVPGVLTAAQVHELREFFRPKFDGVAEPCPGRGQWLFDIYNRHPEARWLPFHEPAVKAVKSLLGADYVLMPECSAARNTFTNRWHKDTTYLEVTGSKFHWEEDFLMVGIAYYLQDNSAEYGGGLDVEPGSHHKPDPFGLVNRPRKRGLWERAWNKLARKVSPGWVINPENELVRKWVSVPNKAGDLLLFHSRLNHRATQPRRPVPQDRAKVSMFDSAARNNSHARSYLQAIARNPEYGFLKKVSYSEELLEAARAAGVQFGWDGQYVWEGSRAATPVAV